MLGALKGPICVTTGAGANVGGCSKMWLCESCAGKGTVEELAGGYYKESGTEELFSQDQDVSID